MAETALDDPARDRPAVVPATLDGLVDITDRLYTLAALLPRHEAAADWEAELDAAVRDGSFAIPRTEFDGVDINTLATWLDRTLPRDALPRDTRDTIVSEVLHLAVLVTDLTGTDHFRVRMLTAAPDRRCGFHVDTVAAGLPRWGALRVFNGDGTAWIDPAHVVSMAEYYHWLQERDRIVRTHADVAARDARLNRHDEDLPFVVDGTRINVVPSRTTILLRHLDARLHWTDHDPRLAWLHCSPMHGAPRLVVNVTPARSQATRFDS